MILATGLSVRRQITAHRHRLNRGSRTFTVCQQIANSLIESINSLSQATKARARGYRSIQNLKAMVYLLTSKLDLRLPAQVRFHPPQTARRVFALRRPVWLETDVVARVPGASGLHSRLPSAMAQPMVAPVSLRATI
jgi:Transposase